MGFVRMVGRLAVYGCIGAALAFPVTYNRGYNDGLEEAFVDGSKGRLEKISDEGYMIHDPEGEERYILDFDRVEMERYSDLEDRLLNDIFSGR
ncbi:MAG: hypothetical protein ACLFSL_02505 [Candidatus Woesearchaeota archaeon]